MAKIFFAWELGGGMGHLMRMRPLVQRFALHGHRVTLSLRQLSRVGKLFEGLNANFLQAPIHDGRSPNYIEASIFPHILNNTGFSEVAELTALVESWLLQLRFAEPDLIVCDHSPTALLAGRIMKTRCAIIGTGFSIPACQGMFPIWRPEANQNPSELALDEARILHNANQVLQQHRQTPLERLAELFAVDATLLTDARELDAFKDRTSTDYRLDWCPPSGKAPQWPGFPGKRVFIYVKPSRCLQHLFTEIVLRRLSTIVYAGGLDRRISELFRAPNIHFEFEPLDMGMIAKQCDLAILNATHSSVLQLLLGGVPQMMLPIFLEQRVTGQRCVELGAARMSDAQTTSGLDKHLDELLSSSSYSENAAQFANKYSSFNSHEALERAIADLLALVT